MSDRSTSVMSVRQAAEFDLACARNGLTAQDVKMLSTGKMLTYLLPVIQGQAGVASSHIINCDAAPFLPNGWQIESHKQGGMLGWNPALIQLYLSSQQQRERNGYAVGKKLYKELISKPVLNACVLDDLLVNPLQIPKLWDKKNIFFWGTVYKNFHGIRVVRYLYKDGGNVLWDFKTLEQRFYINEPAAMRLSI